LFLIAADASALTAHRPSNGTNEGLLLVDIAHNTQTHSTVAYTGFCNVQTPTSLPGSVKSPTTKSILK